MGAPPKTDYPPLLAAGFTTLSLDDVRGMCVDAFPLSTTRNTIMDGLTQVITRLQAANIDAEVWLDGSFMTSKIDPDDVDIVVPFPAQFYDSGTPEQRKALEWVHTNLKGAYYCDSYVFAEFPAGHALHTFTLGRRNYWAKFFGEARSGKPKGIAVVRIM